MLSQAQNDSCECGEILQKRGIHVHSSCVSTDCPCILQGRSCLEECSCVKCKNGKPCSTGALVASNPSETDEVRLYSDMCEQLEKCSYIRSYKSQVYSALVLVRSTCNIIPQVQNACIDSLPNCSVFTTVPRQLSHGEVHAFIITASSNGKKDLIQLRQISGILKGNIDFEALYSYKQFGSLEQPDTFIDFIKQYELMGEEEKLCTAGSTYKCTWNPNSALDFIVQHEITDFSDLLYIYRNIDQGKFDSPSVSIPSWALKEQATNAAAALQMSCRKKLFQDLLFEGQQLIKRKRRRELRLFYILKFIAMHDKCCLHKTLRYLGQKLFEEEGDAVPCLDGAKPLPQYPVAISQYFSWMGILPFNVGVAILKLYNGVGKGRNVAFVGPQDSQKSSLMRAMLLPLTEIAPGSIGTITQGDTQSRFCFENATARSHILCQVDDVTPEVWKMLGGALGPLDGNLPGRVERKYDSNVTDRFSVAKCYIVLMG